MKKHLILVIMLLNTAAVLAFPFEFEFEGNMTNQQGAPLDTTVSMTFKLHTDSTGGTLLWTEIRPSVPITSGAFRAQLGELTALADSLLDNQEVWLGVTIGNDSEMTPRMRLVAVPYAIRAGTVDGTSGGTITSDVIINSKLNVGQFNTNTGSFAVVHGRNNQANGYANVVGGGDTHIASGVCATVSGGFNNQATADEATVGGGQSNIASAVNSTIAGGAANRALVTNSTVGGGASNSASEIHATVSGGSSNTASGNTSTGGGGLSNIASGTYATVGGGQSNTSSSTGTTVGGGSLNTASNDRATIAGGISNQALGAWTAIGGGWGNIARGYYSVISGGGGQSAVDSNSARGEASVIPGGRSNETEGIFSYAAGFRAKAIHNGCFVWGDSTAEDVASTGADQFIVRSCGGTTIYSNRTLTEGVHLASGSSCWQPVDPTDSCDSGGGDVTSVDGLTGGTIIGNVNITGKANIGSDNNNSGQYAFVTGESNDVPGDHAAVTGGLGNSAGGNFGVVGGGQSNTAVNPFSAILGGVGNDCSGDSSAIVGGVFNVITGARAFIGGGEFNQANAAGTVVAGGESNLASGTNATVAGGENNTAGGSHSTIAGGYLNTASGDYSFAAGTTANATDHGSFVWGSGPVATDSWGAFTFTARAVGGTRFYTSVGGAGVELPSGGGAWANLCDVNEKKLLGDVNTSEVLTKVSSLSLHRWSYKSQDESIQHIGPTAQDFYTAFGLGDNNTTISTLDPDGVALAAIQELTKRLETLERENAELKALVRSQLQFGMKQE